MFHVERLKNLELENIQRILKDDFIHLVYGSETFFFFFGNFDVC